MAAVVDALGKHLAMHTVARGQDFRQSGSCCLWSEGHGMSSDMDAISAIVVAIGPATIIAAADGVTIGVDRRLKTARIVSRRGSKVRNFTQALWHMVQCMKRALSTHVSVRWCGRSPGACWWLGRARRMADVRDRGAVRVYVRHVEDSHLHERSVRRCRNRRPPKRSHKARRP